MAEDESNSDEQIIIEFVAKTAGVVDEIQKYRDSVDEMNLELKKASIDQQQSIDDIARKWLELAKSSAASAKAVVESLASIGTPEMFKEMTGKEITPEKFQAFQVDEEAQKALVDELKAKYMELAKIIQQAWSEAKRESSDYSKKAKENIDEEIKARQLAAKGRLADIKQQVIADQDAEKAKAAAAKDAIAKQNAAAAEWAAVTKQGYGVMSAAAQQYGQQVMQIAQQIKATSAQTGQSFQQVAQNMVAAGTPIKQVNAALKTLQTTAISAGSVFQNLGRIILSAFGIYSVVQLFRTFINYLREATEAGKEFAQAQFNLGVGVRALQASGLDVTLKDISEAIDQVRAKWAIFSQKELIEGMGQITLMTREFGLSKEQILNLADASATLAAIMGKDLNEAAKQITLAISSGYAEGLQRAGLNINKQEIANEAMRLGINKTYIAMTGQEKATAALSLITKQLTAIYGDAITIQATRIGQLRKEQAETENLKASIGERLIPIQTALLDAVNEVTRGVYNLLLAWQELQKFWDNLKIPKAKELFPFPEATRQFSSEYLELQKIIKTPQGLQFLTKEQVQRLKDYVAQYKDFLDMTKIPIALRPIEGMGVPFKDLTEGQIPPAQDNADALIQIQNDLYKDLEKIMFDYRNKAEDIEIDLQRKLVDIDREYAQKRLDAERDYFNDKLKLAADYNANVQKENASYAMNVGQEIRQYYLRRDELNRKYRENEIRAEKEFREKLRQLQEDFLLDLEDALHERDARQVLRLIREYNLQKDRAKREYDLEREERKRQHELELKDLEAQKNERLRVLYEEHQARLAELFAEFQREQQLREEEYRRKQEELARQQAQEQADAQTRRDQAMEDLKRDTENRIEELLNSLVDQETFTMEMADSIVKGLNARFGAGGPVDKIYKGLAKMIDNLIYRMAYLKAIADAVGGGGGGEQQTPSPGGPGPEPQAPMAAGGTLFARKPTHVLFGEAGPEIATFTPLSKVGQDRGSSPFGRTSGKINLLVTLDPNLKAEIIEDTLGQAAEIIVEVERKR